MGCALVDYRQGPEVEQSRTTVSIVQVLALPEAYRTQLAMRLGREPSSYPIRHAPLVERFGIMRRVYVLL